MKLQGAQDARKIGSEIQNHLESGNVSLAHASLSAVLVDKNAFRLLDLIGEAVSAAPSETLYPFLDMIAEENTMGGWVVIATALHAHSGAGIEEKLENCRVYIIGADTWYACDCFSERVPGPFLVSDLEETISILSAWRIDSSAWVRRAVGVALHLWAKRIHGNAEQQENARKLFTFIKPMLGEKEYQAAKGVGWGLKTLGRYHPELSFEFLSGVLIDEKQPLSAVIQRKAFTYLPANMKHSLTGLIK